MAEQHPVSYIVNGQEVDANGRPLASTESNDAAGSNARRAAAELEQAQRERDEARARVAELEAAQQQGQPQGQQQGQQQPPASEDGLTGEAFAARLREVLADPLADTVLRVAQTERQLRELSDAQLKAINGIGEARLHELREAFKG